MAGSDALTPEQAIRREAERRRITRLCHVTPLRNLLHIATGQGLLSTKHLTGLERSVFTQQDLDRWDGHPDHICCSIEYPNAYYLRQKRSEARGEARIFGDWVCLNIAPHHLWRADTLLCPHNAAGVRGANVRAGVDAFVGMFADRVVAPRRAWDRRNQPACCPTDAQAEVLVGRIIPLADVTSVVVPDEDAAAKTYTALEQLAAPIAFLPIIVAPDFFNADRLAPGLLMGRRPVEQAWHPPMRHGDDIGTAG